MTQLGTGAPETPPAIAMITAAAVATDSSLRRTVSRPRPVLAMGLGAAGVLVAIVLMVVTRATPSKDAGTAGSATRATAAAVPSSPMTGTTIAPPSDWTPVAPTAAPQHNDTAAPPTVNAAPPARTAPTAAPQATPRVRPVASAPSGPAPAKASCNPPYEFDESGNKRWKRECL